ncbi:hypothetical protein B0H63DRAFT_401670 [Podospora didyma]|uniref:Uncharacterized protein n=1 Tax=Podospora didyma TaxID=330526 RepID=A0AAE0N6B8_9PEZI|nr:hypothetical protein B0H63DRAFT_401670 [Podospora didyma]
MSTMTRLPSESFWPSSRSSTLDGDSRLPFPVLSSDSSSVISPLTLPRGAAGYFDISVNGIPASQLASTSKNTAPGSNRSGQVYSPLSPGVRGPALAQLPQFLSPHLQPVGREVQYHLQQQRSTSLPPAHRDTSRGGKTRASITSPLATPSVIGSIQSQVENSTAIPGLATTSNVPMSALGLTSAGHPRSISADSASAPTQAQTIRRLVQQNGRIREAWEAERKYLEANRERAEEVYKEERALMEDERAEWEAEKVGLLQVIEHLQQQVMSLGGNARSARDKAGFVSSHSLRGGAIWETSPESMRSSQSSQGNTQPELHNGFTASQMPSHVPALRSVASLPQLHTGLGSSGRAASSSLGPDGPTPVVDVQEIHPALEGIPIKTNSIQKPTFTDGPSQNESRTTSTTSSPPTGAVNSKTSPPRGSKEQTLQVLAADESDRLTMHAGHTPSHSLSLLPTMTSSGVATANSSGDSTPTIHQSDGTSGQYMAMIPEGPAHLERPTAPYPTMAASQEQFSEDPEPVFDAAEDRPLKGPLMVRNMPAHDEIFFRRLSDKLEEVSKDTRSSLPAVLQDIDEASESAPRPTIEADHESQPKAQQESQQETSSDSSGEKDKSSPKSNDGEELDIPLKIKRSFNFGAPFGEVR